ncbi:hypothetical protein MSIMFB_04459 [Mycobacterium simulans]|uniref:Uncharacterized protein n=1 Tax=Mycobacterium simulans TaxID=627089 RepID=A0A7Z7INP2_9MYCO|nr:hypothetical protein [Mycobacterium simulans]SOJ56981.1 hypothetical protein MSIMFB_04459 [Mycobacterium simulans]
MAGVGTVEDTIVFEVAAVFDQQRRQLAQHLLSQTRDMENMGHVPDAVVDHAVTTLLLDTLTPARA